MKLNRLTPWLTEGAIREIDHRLAFIENPRIFEFGMGVSTLYYVNRPGLGHLTSVEHDLNWFSGIVGLVPDEKKDKFTPILRERPYYGELPSPWVSTPKYDMILIDGRDRSACLDRASLSIKDRGFIVLDNSERDDYQAAIARIKEKGFNHSTYGQVLEDRWGFTYPGWTTSIFSRC